MHETALARSILQTVQVLQAERNLGQIQRVELELGEFSGVEPLQLKSAFEAQSGSLLGSPAELVLHLVPLTGRCQNCEQEFRIVAFRFVCPHCTGSDVQVIGGEELRILSVRVEQEEAVL